MLDNLSKYVYEVYRSKSVSVAAKKLFISQPALSASIKKAEKELGFPIFNRETIPFTLTPEGKIYIDAIEKILAVKNSAMDKIHSISTLNGGTLRIGTSTNLSYYVIPKICESFLKKHPGINIDILLNTTSDLKETLEKKASDLIFIPLEKKPKNIISETLFEQRMVVAIQKSQSIPETLLPYALTYNEIIQRSYPSEKEVSDTSLFDNIEFLYCHPSSNIYKKRKMLFASIDIDTHITSNRGQQILNYNLMQAGFGALLTTDADISTITDTQRCMYFVLKGETQKFSIAFSEDTDPHTLNIVSEFIKTAKELYCSENPLLQLN